jgi:hypothetical protein
MQDDGASQCLRKKAGVADPRKGDIGLLQWRAEKDNLDKIPQYKREAQAASSRKGIFRSLVRGC